MDDDVILMAEGRGNMASDESEDIASRQAPITSTPGVIEPELIAVPSLAASIA